MEAVSEFVGKLCLVTGAASGIGQAACRMFAKLGGNVIVADVNLKMAEDTKDNLQNDQDNMHSAFHVDISSLESVKKLADQILQWYSKPPTSIIHSAGASMQGIDTTECTEDTWNKVIDGNLKGTFFVNQVFVKLLKDFSMKGSFVNITGIARDGLPRLVPYCASKAGVDGITKSLAKEYAGDGLRFNAVAPGAANTPLLFNIATEDVIKQLTNNCALKRIAMPEKFASVCIFLSSDASSYINGTIVEAFGGKI